MPKHSSTHTKVTGIGTKGPPKSKSVKGYKKPTGNSNAHPDMPRLSPSEKKLNARGAKGKQYPTEKGSGHRMTGKIKGAAKKTRKQPSLY